MAGPQLLYSCLSNPAGNDFTKMFAPLIRDGRMSKFYWKPSREDLRNIIFQMYKVLFYCQAPQVFWDPERHFMVAQLRKYSLSLVLLQIL